MKKLFNIDELTDITLSPINNLPSFWATPPSVILEIKIA